MRFINLVSLVSLLFLVACATNAPKESSSKEYPAFEAGENQAQQAMCVEENAGLLRFSKSYLRDFCPKLKTAIELTCMRFAHSTKDWHKACPGIDTVEKLECFATVANGPGYATLDTLEKCKIAKNRRQVYCISHLASSSSKPLLSESVQECLDKYGI